MKNWSRILISVVGAGLLFLSIFMLASSADNSRTTNAKIGSTPSQINNFNQDLNKAEDHWVHNRLGREYANSGNYEMAIAEYKKAIEIIQNAPGHVWPNLKKEDANNINQQTKIDTQIFSRYRLVEVLEKAGSFEEAIQNVEWLMQNQQIKGKEQLLKAKLEGMKQNLLQKMQQVQQGATT